MSKRIAFIKILFLIFYQRRIEHFKNELVKLLKYSLSTC